MSAFQKRYVVWILTGDDTEICGGRFYTRLGAEREVKYLRENGDVAYVEDLEAV